MKWWQKTIVYQIYPKSFADTTGTGTGDLNGVTAHLDYLKDLGVGAIWLTPIYPSPMVDNGYDISDYSAINPAFGTMADFDKLINEAAKRNIKIVMDLVYNHSSDKHKWFIESKSSRNNAKADWYIWRDEITNWRSIFGGSAWTFCEERGQYYLHTFAQEQPDLNWENPAVRQALYDSANFWLDKGVGGFRIDAITYIKKPVEFKDGAPDGKDGLTNIHFMTANTAGILDFLHEFKRNVFDGHDIFTVGEANGVAAEDLNKWVGNDGVFDMIFEFSHMNLPLQRGEIWCRSNDWKLTELKGVLSDTQAATKNNGWCPIFFENHDQPRSVNHFMPKGANPVKAAKALATILLTMRGTPFIYEGQELGMTNADIEPIERYDDISSHAQYNFAINEGFSAAQAMEFVKFFSRDNARTPMQWNADTNAGFSTGATWLPINKNYVTVNAAAEEIDADSVLNWYKKLINFRAGHNDLINGGYELILPDSEEIFAFKRDNIIIAVNFSLNAVNLPDNLINNKILIDSETDIDNNSLKPLESRIYQID